MEINQPQTLSSYHGWGEYIDTQFTSGSPFLLTGGAQTILPNNAGTKREQQKPFDIASFYDSGTRKILGRNGDGLGILFEFKAEPTTAAGNVRIASSIYLSGAVGEIYPRDFPLTKGINETHYVLSSVNAFTLDTWEQNGGIIRLTAVNSDVNIYDIRYVFTRLHKAR